MAIYISSLKKFLFISWVKFLMRLDLFFLLSSTSALYSLNSINNYTIIISDHMGICMAILVWTLREFSGSLGKVDASASKD